MGGASLLKHTTVLCLVLAVGLALVLFFVKYEVQSLERELAELNRTLAEDRQAVHVLRAEWSHLTDPDRLRRLTQRHLEIRPVEPGQLGTAADIDILPPRPQKLDADQTPPIPNPNEVKR